MGRMRPGLALTVVCLVLVLSPSAGAPGVAPPLVVPPQVSAAQRAKVEAVAREALVSTRIEGGDGLYMRQDLFEYLLDHPEFASQVTRALDIGRYKIWREGGDLWLDEGWGTKGRFWLIHAGPGLRIYHARGSFQQRFLPEVRGEAVAVIEYAFHPDASGRTRVAAAAASYVLIENQLVRAIARLALPIVQAKADKEAWRLLRNLTRASQALESEPAVVYQKVSERADVSRRELAEFRALLRLPAPVTDGVRPAGQRQDSSSTKPTR
jgi:hypothetical protein